MGKPRRLSDPEYIAFLEDNPIEVLNQLNLPPWGAVVKWMPSDSPQMVMDVLVYEAPSGLYLTDVTSFPWSIAPEWEYDNRLWVWRYPSEVLDTIKKDAVWLAEELPQMPGQARDIGVLLWAILAFLVYREIKSL